MAEEMTGLEKRLKDIADSNTAETGEKDSANGERDRQRRGEERLDELTTRSRR